MANEKMSKAPTYIILAFIVGLFVFLIQNMVIDVSTSSGSALSSSSQEYATGIVGSPDNLGFNTSNYGEKIGSVQGGNGTENKNEFSLDFTFGQKSANKLTRFIYITLNMPEFIFGDLLGFPDDDFMWVYDLMDWFLRIFIFIAIVNYIRNK